MVWAFKLSFLNHKLFFADFFLAFLSSLFRWWKLYQGVSKWQVVHAGSTCKEVAQILFTWFSNTPDDINFYLLIFLWHRDELRLLLYHSISVQFIKNLTFHEIFASFKVTIELFHSRLLLEYRVTRIIRPNRCRLFLLRLIKAGVHLLVDFWLIPY